MTNSGNYLSSQIIFVIIHLCFYHAFTSRNPAPLSSITSVNWTAYVEAPRRTLSYLNSTVITINFLEENDSIQITLLIWGRLLIIIMTQIILVHLHNSRFHRILHNEVSLFRSSSKTEFQNFEKIGLNYCDRMGLYLPGHAVNIATYWLIWFKHERWMSGQWFVIKEESTISVLENTMLLLTWWIHYDGCFHFLIYLHRCGKHMLISAF